ncbi:hypothetical protein CMK10_11615 [Candidatus Poribacteria bacterium]|nr:hypothetical protein [Candidatus Poribacteria bacterium]|tara:strand:- start:324 stop:536 length:213 start_codon:yes stop_codon:yes gene_type:complete
MVIIKMFIQQQTSRLWFCNACIRAGTADAAQADDPHVPFTGYYEHWLISLEKILIKKGICVPDQPHFEEP